MFSIAQGFLIFDLVDRLQIAFAGRYGQIAGDQEITPIAIFDLDNLAAFAEFIDILS
jgi:hypothetical protein